LQRPGPLCRNCCPGSTTAARHNRHLAELDAPRSAVREQAADEVTGDRALSVRPWSLAILPNGILCTRQFGGRSAPPS
jgi:hypothetical protein